VIKFHGWRQSETTSQLIDVFQLTTTKTEMKILENRKYLCKVVIREILRDLNF